MSASAPSKESQAVAQNSQSKADRQSTTPSEATAQVTSGSVIPAASGENTVKSHVAAGEEERRCARGNTKDFGFVPIPRRLQYDSERAFKFTTVLNITFGIASTFSEFIITWYKSIY